MISGKTSTGFAWTIEDDNFADDYELLEILRELNKDKSAVVEAVEYVLGEPQARALKEHLRERDDRHKVRATEVEREFKEIFEGVAALKNS